MLGPTSLNNWLEAILDKQARFDVGFSSVAGRLRLPEGWATSISSLPDHLFYFVAEGALEAEINGEFRRIVAGDLIWAARGSQIRFRLPPDQRPVIWRFRLRARDSKGRELVAAQPQLHLSGARTCETWMEQIVDEASFRAPHREVRLRGLLVCLITEIIRLCDAQHRQTGHLTATQRAAVQRYFAEHIASRPSSADLARAAHLSPDYFARCFRRTFGLSPRHWLVEERMRHAALRLLESNATISQIARDLGYEDIFLFSRQFKTSIGESPSHYRAKHGLIERYSI